MKMLTVIGNDYPGFLADITTALENATIDIQDFAGQSIAGTVVFSIGAVPYEDAFHVLSEAGFQVVSNDHLLVRLENQPGALAKLSRDLAQANIDIQGMHIVSKDTSVCIVALETRNTEQARQVLGDRLVQDGGTE
jgi:hypothetical protein